ncbi:MAG: hypothetical protein KatS3mg105_0176 [Gemmatales bacterium]|nr:MAG: hypothetical protein KatS3mg105_0176 [Gemmatales bacterium]
MANELHAFLMKADMPTTEAWQAAIDEAGFDFQLHPQLMPFETTGYVPCKLMGTDAGFEFYFDDSEEMLSEFADIAMERDACVSFVFGSSMADCAAALISGYALAKKLGAIVCFEDAPYDDLDALLAEIRQCIEEVQS